VTRIPSFVLRSLLDPSQVSQPVVPRSTDDLGHSDPPPRRRDERTVGHSSRRHSGTTSRPSCSSANSSVEGDASAEPMKITTSML
jgi:hypothetical protein